MDDALSGLDGGHIVTQKGDLGKLPYIKSCIRGCFRGVGAESLRKALNLAEILTVPSAGISGCEPFGDFTLEEREEFRPFDALDHFA